MSSPFQYFVYIFFCVKTHQLISTLYEPSCLTRSRSHWFRVPTSATTPTLWVRHWSWDTPAPSRIPRQSTTTSDYWKRSWTSAVQYSITTASTWTSGYTPSLSMSAWMRISSCFGLAPSPWSHKGLPSKSLICILRPEERLHYVRSCVSEDFRNYEFWSLYTIFGILLENFTHMDEKFNCFFLWFI